MARRPNNEKSAAPTPKKTFHLEWKNSSQKIAYMAFQQHDVLFLIGPAGVGKAQPLDSLVCTPNGFVKMGSLKLKDRVCTPDGNTALVNGVFPQGKKEIYKITFDDGTSCECSKDHLWSLSHNVNGWKGKVLDTDYIIKNCKNKHGRNVLKIPISNPVYFKEADNLLIPPYFMGILIGEGGFTGSNVAFTSADKSMVVAAKKSITNCYKLSKHDKYGYNVVKKQRSSKPNIYKEQLKQYGLWGHKSITKFIPPEYLHSSVEQRIALLQGLLDSDGFIGKNNSYSLSTSSNRLMRDYCFLVNSLGGVCYVKRKKTYYKKDGKRIQCEDGYICTTSLPNSIKPFRLERKLKRYKPRTKYVPRRIIINIEPIGEKECQCISLDHPQHLYLTDNFTVTHNSFLAMAFAVGEIVNKTKKKILLTEPIVDAGESLGFLPGSFQEKVNPYLTPLYDALDVLIGYNNTPEREKINNHIEVAPLAYLRGRTFVNSICILDEAQNCTKNQIKLFLTRLGENSKIIVTADPTQSDLKEVPFIGECVKLLSDVPGIGIVEFKEDSIVRHPLVSKIIEKLK